MTEQNCIAWVTEPPHHFHGHRCPRKAKQLVGGYPVCGSHAKVALKWQKEERLDSMVAYWWKKT